MTEKSKNCVIDLKDEYPAEDAPTVDFLMGTMSDDVIIVLTIHGPDEVVTLNSRKEYLAYMLTSQLCVKRTRPGINDKLEMAIVFDCQLKNVPWFYGDFSTLKDTVMYLQSHSKKADEYMIEVVEDA